MEGVHICRVGSHHYGFLLSITYVSWWAIIGTQKIHNVIYHIISQLYNTDKKQDWGEERATKNICIIIIKPLLSTQYVPISFKTEFFKGFFILLPATLLQFFLSKIILCTIQYCMMPPRLLYQYLTTTLPNHPLPPLLISPKDFLII